MVVAMVGGDTPGQAQGAGQENVPIDALIEQVEDQGQHPRQSGAPFRVIKRQLATPRCATGAHEEHAAAHYAFALSNLWMVRHQLLAERG